MDCPICGAANSPSQTLCELCDSELVPFGSEDEDFEIDEVNGTLSDTQKIPSASTKKIAIFACTLLILLFTTTFFLISDMLTVPDEVKVSREEFFSLKHSYSLEKGLWKDKKNQILRVMSLYGNDDGVTDDVVLFEGVALEVLLAFLDDDLDLLKRYPNLAVYPQFYSESSSLYLSKPESNNWLPFPVLLSLKVNLIFENEALHIEFAELKKGSELLPTSLARVFFSQELQVLRRLEQYGRGVKALQWRKSSSQEGVANVDTSTVSWKYRNKTFL